MPFRSIEWWLEEDDVYAVIDSLSKIFPEDKIHIIDKGPLEFVANLRGLSHFYGGTPLEIASVIMRSVHPGPPSSGWKQTPRNDSGKHLPGKQQLHDNSKRRKLF
jgi:hypothetical protein